MRNGSYTMGLVLLAVAAVTAGLGSVALIRGMSTRDISPTGAALLGVGVVSFLVSLAMLAKGHRTEPPRFCLRCGEVVDDDAVDCLHCGHALA